MHDTIYTKRNDIIVYTFRIYCYDSLYSIIINLFLSWNLIHYADYEYTLFQTKYRYIQRQREHADFLYKT